MFRLDFRKLITKLSGGEMIHRYFSKLALTALCIASLVLGTSAQMPNPYGAPISLVDAKRVAAPAMTEAVKNKWNMAVAIVDPSGNLVYYEKMDATQLGSANLAIDKARSAALFKRPTKTFQDALAAGGDGLRVLRVPGAIPIDGGLPILIDGKIAGAIGVSGGTSAQDAQCAAAGVDEVAPK
jgi:glc operon protein GlcG